MPHNTTEEVLSNWSGAQSKIYVIYVCWPTYRTTQLFWIMLLSLLLFHSLLRGQILIGRFKLLKIKMSFVLMNDAFAFSILIHISFACFHLALTVFPISVYDSMCSILWLPNIKYIAGCWFLRSNIHSVFVIFSLSSYLFFVSYSSGNSAPPYYRWVSQYRLHISCYKLFLCLPLCALCFPLR